MRFQSVEAFRRGVDGRDSGIESKKGRGTVMEFLIDSKREISFQGARGR